MGAAAVAPMPFFFVERALVRMAGKRERRWSYPLAQEWRAGEWSWRKRGRGANCTSPT